MALRILFLILIIPSFVLGATETFYVCVGGDGTLPETNACATAWDASDFNTVGNWADATDANDGKIGANDDVVLKNDGGNFTATFTVQANGVENKPITIKGESSNSVLFPMIDGEFTRTTGITINAKDYITIRNIRIHDATENDILVIDAVGIIIEESYLSGNNTATHGVKVSGVGGLDCTVTVRRSYVNTGDDCFWASACSTASQPRFVANECISGDDGCDTDDGTIYCANNKITADHSGFDIYDTVGDAGVPSGTFINNIVISNIATASLDCAAATGEEDGCFINVPNDPALDPLDLTRLTINNNKYYAPNGATGEDRVYYGEGANAETFTQWQAEAGSPDASSTEGISVPSVCEAGLGLP